MIPRQGNLVSWKWETTDVELGFKWGIGNVMHCVTPVCSITSQANEQPPREIGAESVETLAVVKERRNERSRCGMN